MSSGFLFIFLTKIYHRNHISWQDQKKQKEVSFFSLTSRAWIKVGNPMIVTMTTVRRRARKTVNTCWIDLNIFLGKGEFNNVRIIGKKNEKDHKAGKNCLHWQLHRKRVLSKMLLSLFKKKKKKRMKTIKLSGLFLIRHVSAQEARH